MIAKKGSKSKLRVIRDKRGQAEGGFLDHPIVYVIILFGLAAIIGSVMMMIVSETDKVVAPNLDTPTVSNESWVYNNVTSTTWCKQLNNTGLQSGTEKVYNASGWTGAKDVDYNVSYSTGILCNLTTTMVNGTYGVDYKYSESKWNTSYVSVVSGVTLGFSMYKLVVLMGIMSVVLPMLFLIFARRREE